MHNTGQCFDSQLTDVTSELNNKINNKSDPVAVYHRKELVSCFALVDISRAFLSETDILWGKIQWHLA